VREQEWSIGALAGAAGVTARTLRHYDDLGLVRPSRTDGSGRRYYDRSGLLRLQRVLLLRDMGVPLAEVADLLDGEADPVAALRVHAARLVQERDRVDRQLAAVAATVVALEEGRELVADEVLDGFDHTVHEAEVTERWGSDAYARGDRWWRALSAEERAAFQQEQQAIAAAFAAAARAGRLAASADVQELAERQVAWLRRSGDVPAERVAGLGQLYVDDPRFREQYDRHGSGTAVLVRDALQVWAATPGRGAAPPAPPG
jgi:DNA-binding transcriptional MerR regulator